MDPTIPLIIAILFCIVSAVLAAVQRVPWAVMCLAIAVGLTILPRVIN